MSAAAVRRTVDADLSIYQYILPQSEKPEVFTSGFYLWTEQHLKPAPTS